MRGRLWLCTAHHVWTTGDCPRCDAELIALAAEAERVEVVPECGAQYGHNPDRCYQPAGHAGTHSNRWGTTWAEVER